MAEMDVTAGTTAPAHLKANGHGHGHRVHVLTR